MYHALDGLYGAPLGGSLQPLLVEPRFFETNTVSDNLHRLKIVYDLDIVQDEPQETVLLEIVQESPDTSYVVEVSKEVPFHEQATKTYVFEKIDEFNRTHGIKKCYLKDEAKATYGQSETPLRFINFYNYGHLNNYIYERNGFFLYDNALQYNMRDVEQQVVEIIGHVSSVEEFIQHYWDMMRRYFTTYNISYSELHLMKQYA